MPCSLATVGAVAVPLRSPDNSIIPLDVVVASLTVDELTVAGVQLVPLQASTCEVAGAEVATGLPCRPETVGLG